MAETVAKLAYDEAVRTITAQAGVLDNLRSRAGTLIAVASLVTSFLGGQALAKPTFSNGVVVRPEIESWGMVAVVTFVVVALLAIVVLYPYTWRFEVDASAILEWPADDYEAALSAMAGYHANNHKANEARLIWLFRAFGVGCVFLVAETIAWIFALAGTRWITNLVH